jgi:hypothetical protein
MDNIINLHKANIHFLIFLSFISFALFKSIFKLILCDCPNFWIIILLVPCPTLTISSKNSIKPLLKSSPFSGKSEMLISTHKNFSSLLNNNATNSCQLLRGSTPNGNPSPKKTYKKNTRPSSKVTKSSLSSPKKKYNWPKNSTILFTNQLKNSTSNFTFEVKNTPKFSLKPRVKKAREKAVQTKKSGKTTRTNPNTVTAAKPHLDKW